MEYTLNKIKIVQKFLAVFPTSERCRNRENKVIIAQH